MLFQNPNQSSFNMTKNSVALVGNEGSKALVVVMMGMKLLSFPKGQPKKTSPNNLEQRRNTCGENCSIIQFLF